MIELNRVEIGDCRAILPTLPEQTFQCCVTSPPYWGLRDYGHAEQIGREPTPGEYVAVMVDVFREVRRVLRDDGTCWLNLGDSYANTSAGAGGQGKQWTNHGTVQMRGVTKAIPDGLKPKDLVGIPWRVALALQADGWWLRSDIIWSKLNHMPESVTDRPTRAHEYVFLLAKSERYFYDAAAVAEKSISGPYTVSREKAFAKASKSGNHNQGAKTIECGETKNARSVWPIALHSYLGAHFATMPPALATRCILAGSSLGSAVLDPFMGSGTVGQVAESLGRRWFGCELNAEYGKLSADRTAQLGLVFSEGGS